MHTNIHKFAGPCAQGVLDPVMIPCPISQGCDRLFWLKNLLIWAFLGTSAHESVPLVGYLLATCWLLAGLPLWVAGQKSNENPRVKRRSALHGRIWAPLEPSWNQLEPTCGQLGVCLTQLSINLVEKTTRSTHPEGLQHPTQNQKTSEYRATRRPRSPRNVHSVALSMIGSRF